MAGPIAVLDRANTKHEGHHVFGRGLGVGTVRQKTIASGTIVYQGTHMEVVGEGDASDQLDTVTGAEEGDFLILRPDQDDEDITIAHAVGADKFICPGETNIVLAEDTDFIFAIHNGTQWVVLAYQTGAAGGGALGALLAGVTATTGAALVGYDDANASVVGATVKAVLDEMFTPLTLTPGTEATDVIAVTVASPSAQVTAYRATVYDDTGVPLATAFSLAETGAGAEVSATGKATLIFTTDAAGAATISVTDAVGASGKTVILEITPLSASAGTRGSAGAYALLTFD